MTQVKYFRWRGEESTSITAAQERYPMDTSLLPRRANCRFQSGPVRLLDTYGECADIHGCQGIDCPYLEFFADTQRGITRDNSLADGWIPLLLQG